MSLAEIIHELPKLSVEERSAIWQRLAEISGAEVPPAFHQGMQDLAQGRQVEMEQALNEPPPPPYRA